MSRLTYRTPGLVDVDLFDGDDPSMWVMNQHAELTFLPLPSEAVRMLAAGAVCTILTWAVEWATAIHWKSLTLFGEPCVVDEGSAYPVALWVAGPRVEIAPRDFGPFDGEDARFWLQRTLGERGSA